MSIVLSIYSQEGFREVALPERGPKELRVLLRRELFDLSGDLTLVLEKQEGVWQLAAEGGSLIGHGMRNKSVPITGGMTPLEVEQRGGRRVTIISTEQVSPFMAYRKYNLAGLKEISIGNSDRVAIQCKNDFISREHCAITFQNGKAVLIDKGKNGTYVNFRRVHGKTALRYGDSIRIMQLNLIYLGNVLAVSECDGLRVNTMIESCRLEGAEKINQLAAPARAGGGGRILFHRSPRNLHKLHTETIEIEAPPQPQEMQDQPLSMQIGPALTMAIPMMLGSSLSVLGNSSGASLMMYAGMITAVVSALIGAFWALASVRYTAKTRRQAENRRFESYSEYLIRMRDRIEQKYKENSDALRERYQSADACCALNGSSPLLWNRNASHEDFLAVRLGMGDLPFQAPIQIPQERFTLINDSLADKPKLLQDNFRMLKGVPVTVDLLKNRVVGVAGGENCKNAIAIAQAMIAQIAASNCYTDVKIAIVCDESSDIDRDAWGFAMWLPHVWSGDKKIRYMAMNRSERGDVFYALTQTLRNRNEEDERHRSLKPRIVLFVSNPTLLDGEAIAHYVFDREQDLGLSTVLLAGRPEELPNECECVVECDSQFQGVYDTRAGRSYGTAVQFDQVTADRLGKFAKALGQIEVVDSDQEGEIPNALTFFDMFGINRPENLDAPARWQKSDVISSMQALVGFKSGNVPCYLDINEKYHGPHGLVAGTTGSGKSETLQTYILSLAVNYSPEDVGFFIIDYKGGGMANLFDNLPHMIGSISNLSGNQVKRAMVSIQSENRRRQRIFTEYGVNSINGYTALYKNSDTMEPVPHLFIIIDEFAELKREEPEFMKELISVAQVGRSLGVHMILSTQRPSGTVDENIWANSKFRLCLRVQDRQDSMDMLHRVEAAYLTQAGRCYLQVGNDEIFELFQSGWSGASYDAEMGGGSLLIAQMLSVTGKVDLAGNRSKRKRKEERKRGWIGQLVEVLEAAQAETGVSVSVPGFDFNEHQLFRDTFYSLLHEKQPEFEESQFNNARIQDFIVLYREAQGSGEARVQEIIALADASSERRLPEVRSKTQLEVTVDYLRAAAQAAGMKKIRKLWMPVLPENLYLDGMDAFRNVSGEDVQQRIFNGTQWPERPAHFHLSALIGMADDPANQAQFPVSLDFARGGHHMVVGTVSTGKSTFAQSVVYSLMASYSPDLLNIYCLDFSAKMLAVFAGAPHVGGYLDDSSLDSDAFPKFFTMISRILDERRERFAGTSFTDAMNHDGWTMPAILIVIDNLGSFREKTDERYDAAVNRIIREGNAYGIYLLVTGGGISMQEIPSRMAENFRTSLCLELPDPFAYGEVLHITKPDVLPENRVKGRGLMYWEGRILEYQTALAAPSKSGEIGVEGQPDPETNPPVDAPERNDRIKEAVERMNAAWGSKNRAKEIPIIPEHPLYADFAALPAYQEALKNPALLPAGYDYEDASVYSLDLKQNFSFLISGGHGTGKSMFMQNLMLNCAARQHENPELNEQVHIIEIGARDFEWIAGEHGWKRYSTPEQVHELFAFLREELKKRNQIRGAWRERKGTQDELFEDAQANPRINLFITTPIALAESMPASIEVPLEPTDKVITEAAENDAAKAGETTDTVQAAKTDEKTETADSAETATETAEEMAVSKETAANTVPEETAPSGTDTEENAENVQADAKNTGDAKAGDAKAGDAKAVKEEPKTKWISNPDKIWLDAICQDSKGLNLFVFVEVSDKDLERNFKGFSCYESLSEHDSGIRFGGNFNKQNILTFANINYRMMDEPMKDGIGVLSSRRKDQPLKRFVVPMP